MKCMSLLENEVQSISLNIETLILVAVWKSPFVFQGSFSITNKHHKELLFFRCECFLKNKDEIQNEFFPPAYQFTHLYNEKNAIPLSNDSTLQQALYLLKYALKSTLEKLVNNPQQSLMYVDEVAMSCISNQAKDYLENKKPGMADNDIGFAVSIDFVPHEDSGKTAASKLLELCTFVKKNSLH